jgi:hypothetical protein
MEANERRTAVPATYAAPLNEGLVRDIIRTARLDPSSLRFKFYAREMQWVLEDSGLALSDAIRTTLTLAITQERERGHN